MSTAARFTFVKATKTGSYIRLALTGPTGAGKTFTALTLAGALGTNPGLIDTDRKRARKYADRFDFDHLEMDRFDPADLTRAVLAAAAQDINPLVVDTASPFWSGPDGMLDSVGRAGTQFEGWRKMGPVEQQMMDALLGYPGHVIVTLKTKMKYVVEEDEKGKMKPRRIGLEPEQRGNFGSEFDIVGDMDDAVMRIGSTCLCPELTGKVIERPTAELADTILAWLARDAVGEPLNPLTVADWAVMPGRIPEELGARYRELEAAGQLSAVVSNPFWTGGEERGEFVAIGELLLQVSRNIRDEQKRNSLGGGLLGAVAA